MDTVQDRAAYWVAREDLSGLDAAGQLERDTWLGADRRHLGAYARAQAVFARTGRARILAGRAEAQPVSRGDRYARLRWAVALAACLVLAVGAVALGSQGGHDYATARGEVLRVVLEDGSVVTLNADSKLHVRYTDQQRQIQLERGEALFDVAKHRHRPFVVHAGGTTVTAVGTSFSVNLPSSGPGNVEVLVREGVVDVADEAEHIAPARLPANHRALSVRDGGIRIESLPEPDVGAALAWREGMLAFRGDTLSVAAARFHRYSDQRIVIDDPRVGSLRIVGLYAANDPAGFARSVSVSLGLKVEQTGNLIQLKPQAALHLPALTASRPAAGAGTPHDKQPQERR